MCFNFHLIISFNDLIISFHQLMNSLQFPREPPGVFKSQFGKPWSNAMMFSNF